MSVVHTKAERKFIPHRFFLSASEHFIAMANHKHNGYYYEWLGAIILSALSIEAVGNSYGKVLIPNWRDLISERIKDKRGASPRLKLELVAQRCGVAPDFTTHPWLTIQKLTHFRDSVAHATRDSLEVERECTETDFGWVLTAALKADMETMITEEFARQSCDAVTQIISSLNKTLKPSELHELTYDGNESYAKMV
jgi:hypothetical protein